MYFLIFMSNRWMVEETESIRESLRKAQRFADEGYIVAFCDDLETFADGIRISVDDIEIVN